MKKIIIGLLCLGFIISIADISFADSWNARKNKVKKLLKKKNLVSSDRFELTYGQKVTDRMSNHFVYILRDSKTNMEYLIYAVGDGDSTSINNLAITPLLLAMPPPMMPSFSKDMMPSISTNAADKNSDKAADVEEKAADVENVEGSEETAALEQAENKL